MAYRRSNVADLDCIYQYTYTSVIPGVLRLVDETIV